MQYDIIGDIHGHAVLLENMLTHLGYKETKGVFNQANRKAIFVGDFVDRGPNSMKAVSIVRRMVEEGFAEAVPGNHEFNLLCYFKKEGDQFLRTHNEKNASQIEETLKSYQKYDKLLEEDLAWMQSLPIFLEKDGIRIIHAAWIKDDINYLKENYTGLCLSDQLLQDASDKENKAYGVIENLLKGVETSLPGNTIITDSDQNIRKKARVKWWEYSEGKSLSRMLVKPIHEITDHAFEGSSAITGYDANEVPVFFGHYCLIEHPALIKHNVCCVDYCVYKYNRLIAYRWGGEKTLDEVNLVII